VFGKRRFTRLHRFECQALNNKKKEGSKMDSKKRIRELQRGLVEIDTKFIWFLFSLSLFSLPLLALCDHGGAHGATLVCKKCISCGGGG